MEGTPYFNINYGLRSNNDQIPKAGFFQYIKVTFNFKLVKLLKRWTFLRQSLASSIARRNFLLQCRNKDVFPKNIQNTSKRNYNINFYSNSCSSSHKNLISFIQKNF